MSRATSIAPSLKAKARRVLAVSASISLIVIGLAASANATGGEHGVLLIHGPGTGFTRGDSIVSITTTPGGTATFTLEVKNTGTDTAQYNLTMSNNVFWCANTCDLPTLTLTTGSVIGTPLALSANGYFTPPIAAGKTATFTLKATLPKSAVGGSDWVQQLALNDTAQHALDNEAMVENATATKATAGDDQIVTGSGGQKPFISPDTYTYTTDPSLAPGGRSTYSVKLENDGAVPTQIGYYLSTDPACVADFPASVKVGTVDVTAAALAGTYKTPVLTTGRSTTLTVTIAYGGNPNYCGDTEGSGYWIGMSSTPNDPPQYGVLLVSGIAH